MRKSGKFGLMPSQKGNLTLDEAKTIASWLYENFPPKGFNKMSHKKNGKRNSPFLITKGLPHLSKLVKMEWDSKKLNLTKEQKKKLLQVRKSTMSAVKSLKPQVNKLQTNIISLTNNSKDRKKIYKLIDKLSKLKAKATKVHVDCITNTKKILTSKQLHYLLNK